MQLIALHGKIATGRTVMVDDEDCGLVSAYRWRAYERSLPTGGIKGPYALTAVWQDGRAIQIQMHRLITGWPLVDHINHDGLDNRRANLRPATIAQNRQNSLPLAGCSSRYKGVTWHRQLKKWQAQIGVNGRKIYLGIFASEEDAANAYNAAAADAFGAYALLNEAAG